MGKGSRIRTDKAAVVSDHAGQAPGAGGPYFHGGVPGQQVGQTLLPAQQLGIEFQYLMPGAIYDPAWVYITSDDGVANAYASKYREPTGAAVAGDVYEVQPLDVPQPDPDNRPFPEVYLRCRRAQIVRVVATGVWLTTTEQNQLERHYVVWGRRDRPVWDDAGVLIPSEQMAANGVTREWTSMLRPWLGPAEVDAKGKLSIAARSTDPWRTILESVPVLDRDCQIQASTHWWTKTRSYRCRTCGERPDSQSSAVLHQLGARPVAWLTRIYEWQAPPLPPLVQAAMVRNRSRWQWLAEEQ